MKKILVPSDFSANATTALRYAIRLCNTTQANLLVLHCAHYPANTQFIAETETQKDADLKHEADTRLKKLQSQVHNAYKYLGLDIGNTVKVQVEFNPFVVEKTIEVAKHAGADLIVMGTHGASGINKFLFGSNTSVMLSKSPIPVLAVPGDYHYKKIETLVFASDFENFKHELEKVTTFAKEIGAGVTVLHFKYGTTLPFITETGVAHAIQQNGYDKITPVVKEADARYPLLKQLRDYVNSNKPRCLVMFTKERGFWEKIFLSSKTEDLATALPVPLLSFKK